MRSNAQLDGPLSAHGDAVVALLHAAMSGEGGEVRGQDPIGSWSVAARLNQVGSLVVTFEIANNTAVWTGDLEEIDGNLTLWGEFDSPDPHHAVERLIDLEAEAHRLAYLVGGEV